MKILQSAAMAATCLSTGLFAGLITTPAFAHATLEVKEAPVNKNYKAVIRISHGCDGAPTKSVSLSIPEGVISVKPMPKAGWELSSKTAAYAKTYEYHGPKSEGVTEITWTGVLEDGHYDEFIFRARITDSFTPGDVIYFPVVQTSTEDANPWVEIPAEGQSRRDLDHPAPGLTVTPAAKAHPH
ncbi:MAG: DUF1775 domain-containing protein [Mangrovicoccus sp.]|nr:DUF1775 domain-containing protein [Mangrovicoccus sp.]